MTNIAPKKSASASKYTPEMEAKMKAAAPLNAAKADALAAEFGNGITGKSVIAKATRMGLPYEKKVATTKTGGKVESKEKIVAELAALIGENLDGLEKAPKPVLQNIRDYVAFMSADADDDGEPEAVAA